MNLVSNYAQVVTVIRESWMDIFWALWRKTLYKYPWDEKSALISVVGMSKEAICFSRSWVGTAELGHWCQNHTYKFCQVNPNWACHFELSIHKPKIRFKSSLTKVTTSHFSKDVIKHYILIILLLRCRRGREMMLSFQQTNLSIQNWKYEVTLTYKFT